MLDRKLTGRLGILVLLVLSILAFIMSMLSLCSGNNPGFMVDYHVIALDASNLTVKSSVLLSRDVHMVETRVLDRVNGAVDKAKGKIDDTIEKGKDEIGGVVDGLMQKAAKELGLAEFYSLHVMSICEGDLGGTAGSDLKYNTTECRQTASRDVSSFLNRELGVGPFKLSLAKLGVSDELERLLKTISTLLNALTIVYSIAAGLTGLGMLTTLVWATVAFRGEGGIGGDEQHKWQKQLVIINSAVYGLAWLVLLVVSAVVTGMGKRAVSSLAEHGSSINLKAIEGWRFQAITWTAFAAAFICFCAFARPLLVRRLSGKHRRGSPGAYRGKEKISLDSSETRRGANRITSYRRPLEA